MSPTKSKKTVSRKHCRKHSSSATCVMTRIFGMSMVSLGLIMGLYAFMILPGCSIKESPDQQPNGSGKTSPATEEVVQIPQETFTEPFAEAPATEVITVAKQSFGSFSESLPNWNKHIPQQGDFSHIQRVLDGDRNPHMKLIWFTYPHKSSIPQAPIYKLVSSDMQNLNAGSTTSYPSSLTAKQKVSSYLHQVGASDILITDYQETKDAVVAKLAVGDYQIVDPTGQSADYHFAYDANKKTLTAQQGAFFTMLQKSDYTVTFDPSRLNDNSVNKDMILRSNPKMEVVEVPVTKNDIVYIQFSKDNETYLVPGYKFDVPSQEGLTLPETLIIPFVQK